MASLTPFGITLREIRVTHQLRLLDLAKALQLSVPFLSAVETGRKPIPDGFVLKLSRSLDLSTKEIEALRKAKDRTNREIRVGQHSEEQRELIAAFARRLDDLPDDMLEEIKSIVLKSMAGERPFERKRRGFKVPPRKTNELRALAEKVRSVFVPSDQVEFPIIDVLELAMPKIDTAFVLRVCDEAEMGEDEGLVPVGGNELILRSDVYEGACNGAGRHRFTAAHEFAHYIMHRKIGLARTRSESDMIYTDSEWQADTFAGTLLMSPRHAPAFATASEMADACLVTPAAAAVMRSKYFKEGILAH